MKKLLTVPLLIISLFIISISVFASSKKVEDECEVDSEYDLDYIQKNGMDCFEYYAEVTLKLIETENGYLIGGIDSKEGEFTEFADLLEEFKPASSRSFSTYSASALSKAADLWLDAINEMDKTNPNEGEMVIDTEAEIGIQPMAASSYSYNVTKGVDYAKKYAKNRNKKFYSVSSDCTNFVSQCVRAAYGGTDSGIQDKKRMTGTWYGRSGGGTAAWEQVVKFYDYAVKSKSTGPKGTGSNNNKVYKSLAAVLCKKGSVLQVRASSSGKYTHSVYVIEEKAKTSLDYQNVKVAQHSPNKTRSVADLISYNGASKCNMRRITFTSAKFDK